MSLVRRNVEHMKILSILLFLSLMFSSTAIAGEIEYDIHASDGLWDTIKLKTSPKSYWQEKVKSLEWAVKFGRGQIRDLTLEYKKLLATKDIELAQAANFAQSIGEDPRQARRETWEELKEDLIMLREQIKEEREILKRDQAWLEQARRELAKHQ